MISLTMMELQRNMPRAKTKSSDSLKKKKWRGRKSGDGGGNEFALFCFAW